MKALTFLRNGTRFMPAVLLTGLSGYFIYSIDRSEYPVSATHVVHPALENTEPAERQDAEAYVTGHVGMRRNFVNEIVIEGELRSIARAVSYKDVVLHVEFLSKSGEILFTKDHTVNDTLQPGGCAKYKFKIPPSMDVDHLEGKIANAQPL